MLLPNSITLVVYKFVQILAVILLTTTSLLENSSYPLTIKLLVVNVPKTLMFPLVTLPVTVRYCKGCILAAVTEFAASSTDVTELGVNAVPVDEI